MRVLTIRNVISNEVKDLQKGTLYLSKKEVSRFARNDKSASLKISIRAKKIAGLEMVSKI
jgi:hypothetical protein